NAWADEISNQGLSESLRSLQQNLDRIVELYPNRGAILPESQKALRDVRKLSGKVASSKLDQATKNDLLHKLNLKEEQLVEISRVASELTVDITIDSYVLTQGEQAEVEVTVTNEGSRKLHHGEAELLTPEDGKHEKAAKSKHLKPGESKAASFTVTVPEDAEYFEPYAEAAIQAQISFKENGVDTAFVSDLDNTVSVLPELGVTPDPVNITVNTADVQEKIPVSVKVKNYDDATQKAEVSLKLPEGWSSEPESAEVNLEERFEEKSVSFDLIPPSDVEEGEFTIEAIA